MRIKTHIVSLAFVLAIWLNVALPFYTSLPATPPGKLLICTESGFKLIDTKDALPGDIHKTPKCPFCLLSHAVKNPYNAVPVAGLSHPVRIASLTIVDGNILFGKAHSPTHYASRAPPVIL